MGLLAEDRIMGLLGTLGGPAENSTNVGILYAAIFFCLNSMISLGVKLLRSNNLNPRDQAFRRLFGHGVEKLLTA